MSGQREAAREFDCFGSRCAVLVTGDGPAGTAEQAAQLAQQRLLERHCRFSRFLPESELTLLNADPRESVPVSLLMARFAQAVVSAGESSGGLVDGTLLKQIENAGYAGELPPSLGLGRALELAPARNAATPAQHQDWRLIEVDADACTVRRPPGVMLDSGGIAKGLFADELAGMLAGYESFAINCAGDLHLGGSAGLQREIHVQSPFDESVLHTFSSARTGVATSGIGRRSWLDASGRPAHHLLDPGTGRPAFTGVVQVTALDPHARAAEVRAKAAILSGPRRARSWLAHGGVIVMDDGSFEVVRPASVVTLSDLSAFTGGARTHDRDAA
jgi:thiamine biosynthesis lipoprotein